jgi:hypothetical protein
VIVVFVAQRPSWCSVCRRRGRRGAKAVVVQILVVTFVESRSNFVVRTVVTVVLSRSDLRGDPSVVVTVVSAQAVVVQIVVVIVVWLRSDCAPNRPFLFLPAA